MMTRALTVLCAGSTLCAAKPNVADPEVQPYADPAGGREGYRLAGETVNEARLYDFYQRQADHYMALSPGELPEVLPAYPGLDAGRHGHWGKHNQNNHNDGRWNEIEIGSLLTQVTRGPEKLVVLKGINVKVGEGLSVCFDPQRLAYAAVWKGWVKFHPFRWGTSRNATIDGEVLMVDRDTKFDDADSEYLGFYRYGERVVFHYRAEGAEVLDSPGVKAGKFIRTVQYLDKDGPRTPLQLSDTEEGDLALATKGGGAQWSKRTVTTRGELGAAPAGSAYAVDTLTVPYDNPFGSVMQLSGIAFDPEGTAYVSTLCGEVWTVRGIDGGLEALEWRRFACGLNQPMGIHIDKDGLFVLDRGQIYRLHDLDGDGEADYYENYANDFGGYANSHSHTFGLHRTADGSFHFTQRESVMRTAPDRLTEEVGWGVRNCMGIGGSADFFWVGPQEGTWTPATSIIEVKEGEFYGLPKGGRAGSIAAPLCFIPRGVDNSVGGFVEIGSDRWGPFRGRHVGLSYGSGLHYIVLRDDSGERPQGAVVPLAGEFLAGSVRGAFHPKDGQLYVVGLDGWGDYSVEDGCFHRVRYTGAPVYKPCGFRVHENGLRIDFTTGLDREAAGDVENYFAHAWNYEYAKRYGSPEFSAKRPGSLGHDPVEIRSVQLLEGGRSIFVEMPGLEPVMQLHIRMHLEAEDRTPFEADLFASPMYPSAHYRFDGAAGPVAGKPTAVALRVESSGGNEGPAETGQAVEGARELLVEAVGGLQYKQTQLEAKAGEALALRLTNADVMPHNLVIVAPGAMQKVGTASFAMLNDPEAGKKNYAPDLPEVLHVIPVINPGKQHVLHFRAPAKPGDYPYICTFPGHWQAMRGVLRVGK